MTPEQREAEYRLDDAVQKAMDAGLSVSEIADLVSEYLLANGPDE